MAIADSKFGFGRVIENFEKVEHVLPPLLAGQARNYFLDRFQAQEWDGKPWKDVLRRTDPQHHVSPPKTSSAERPILLGWGTLRKAVNGSVVSEVWSSMKLVVDMRSFGFKENYAAFLNYGTPKMIARPFMGQTKELHDMQIKLIMDTIDNIWQA